jgi:Protein of unknown function (DUF3800)
MSPKGSGDPEELEASRDERVATRRREKMEQYVAALRRAEHLRREGGGGEDDPVIRDLLSRADSEFRTLQRRAGGPVFSRRRPKKRADAGTCTVYLDECGSHELSAPDPYPVFALSAVIVPEADYSNLDARWKGWKAEVLGQHDAIVHEPTVRNRLGPFGGSDGPQVIEKLTRELGELDFTGIICAVHRANYIADFGLGPLDESLPAHVYLMTLDFLLERVVMALDTVFGGARAEVVAESRGPREDALLQYEFARLHLDGTSYIAPGWFRQQLAPGVVFRSKGANITGLQLADLIARPVADKVADPNSTPPRWPEVRRKLCVGQETKHSILGLKVLPWREEYEDLWKS